MQAVLSYIKADSRPDALSAWATILLAFAFIRAPPGLHCGLESGSDFPRSHSIFVSM